MHNCVYDEYLYMKCDRESNTKTFEFQGKGKMGNRLRLD